MRVKKDRIIIDTNLWISFLLTKDFSRLDKPFSDHSIVLLFSQELLDEFIEVAQRPKFKQYFSLIDLQELLMLISQKAIFTSVISSVTACRDNKDNFLLSLANDGKATHLITGDKDLLEMKVFGRTRILTFTEYLADK